MEGGGPSAEREVRIARNESLFRSVNERVREVTVTLLTSTDTHTITCECAKIGCTETLEITAEAYEAVRSNPRRFSVLPGHVLPEAEDVVSQADAYVVVEKHGVAGEVAEANDPRLP